MNLKYEERPESETKAVYSPQTTLVKEQKNTPAPPPPHIHKLLKSWLSFHPIAPIAHAHLATLPVSPKYPMRLLRQVTPGHSKVRTLAAWLLGELSLTEEERREAIQILGKTAETSNTLENILMPFQYAQRSMMLGFICFGIYIPIFICLFFDKTPEQFAAYNGTFWGNYIDLISVLGEGFDILTSYVDAHIGGSMVPPMDTEAHTEISRLIALFIVLVVLPSPITLPLSLRIDRKRQRLVRLEAIEALRKRGEVTALPYLLGALKSRDAKIVNAAYQVVLELLPKLTAEHYGYLRSDVGQNLCLLFGARYDLPYLTILDAIEKVGDSRAIPKIQWVLANEPKEEIKRRCQEVLLVLNERKEQEKQSKDLLRASQEPISKETLLRPASTQAEGETDTLLRPIDTSH
jgi:hypothetical protein